MSAHPAESGDPVSITFRTQHRKRQALDEIARSMERDRSYILNEAIDQYLELHEWQCQQVDQGLRAANSGDFLSENEIRAAIAKWHP